VATASHRASSHRASSAKKSHVVRASAKRRVAPRQRVVVTRSKAASRHSKAQTSRVR
jgi:hypothetical protein